MNRVMYIENQIKNDIPSCQVTAVLFMFIIAQLCVVISPEISFGADYYVDSLNGDDGNRGISPNEAWRSVYKVNTTTLSPGDNIYFRRGGLWRDLLKAGYSGMPAAPITYSAYGNGDMPVISASRILAGWEFYLSNIWRISSEHTVQVFVDGDRCRRQGSLVALQRNRDWYQNDDHLYLYSDANPDDGYLIESSNKFYAVNVTGSHVNISGLEVKMASGDGMAITNGADDVQIRNVKSSLNYWTGIKISTGGTTSEFCIIDNCETVDNGGSGIALANTVLCTISNNRVTRNCQLDTGEEQHQWDACIKMTGAGSRSNILEHNICSNARYGAGIWLDFCGPENIVRYNQCFANQNNGIYNEITSHTQIYYNLSYNNEGASTAAGIWISGRDGEAPYGGDADSNYVANNVCYGNEGFGILLHNDDGVPGNTEHNVIRNNISVSTLNGPNLRVGGAAENSPNTIEYNCFGPESRNFIEWGWGAYMNSYGAFEGAYGGSTHSVESAPHLVDAVSGDFHIHPGSPVIDAGGMHRIEIETDLGGTPVPQGDAIDVGAYEFVAPDLPPSPPRNVKVEVPDP